MTKSISDTLNLPDISNNTSVSKKVKSKNVDNILTTPREQEEVDRDDFEFVRDSYYEVIETGMEAVQKLVEVAQQSQSARDFEVVATLIKSVNESNRDLADLLKKRKTFFEEKTTNPQTVNNNLFVGTTEDLQALISKTLKNE